VPATRTRPPKRRRSRLEATAYHEAGHAVAAYLRNRRFTSISIIADGETLGQCVFGNKPGVIVLDAESYRRTRDRIETLIIVSLAGVLAECLLTGRRNWRGAHADLHDAAGYAAYVTGDEQELGAYIKWLWERTRNLLRQRRHWAAVKSLASELLVSRRVGERRARLVIAEALTPRAAGRRRRARAEHTR
jgi:hypothetical protein